MRKAFLILSVIIVFVSCNDYTPKPVGYNRIDVPQNSYQKYETPFFSFLYSEYAVIDSLSSEKKSDVWFNISYKYFNARIHCSYFPIIPQTFRETVNDSHNFAFSHVLKADGIEQTVFRNEKNKTSGLIYEIEGNVATPIQFYITDSISNFFRASFYFNNTIKQDSVAPVTDFIRKDIQKLLESFEWK